MQYVHANPMHLQAPLAGVMGREDRYYLPLTVLASFHPDTHFIEIEDYGVGRVQGIKLRKDGYWEVRVIVQFTCRKKMIKASGSPCSYAVSMMVN